MCPRRVAIKKKPITKPVRPSKNATKKVVVKNPRKTTKHKASA